MVMFLSHRHSENKMQILGRWKALAFLDHIRPQVLEQTNLMAVDIAKSHDMLDLNNNRERLSQERFAPEEEPGMFPKFCLRR